MKGKTKKSPKTKCCPQGSFKSAPFGTASSSFPPKGLKVSCRRRERITICHQTLVAVYEKPKKRSR
jgi:hypothetical protein